MMNETIVEVENYEEVVGGFTNSPFQSDNRTGDAAAFKGPTPNRNDNSMASTLRLALRNSNLRLAEETKESQAMVVTSILAIGRCPSVTCVYCIQMANDIIKHFLNLVAPSINLVF